MFAALHPSKPQDVLEGVLAERSALLKQTHELQGQLAAAADAAIQRMAGQMTAQAVANILLAFGNGGWHVNSSHSAAAAA